MNIQQKMMALLQNAIALYKKNPSHGLWQIKQVEEIQHSLESTGEGLRNFKQIITGIKIEIAFSRLTNGNINEFAHEFKVYPMSNPTRMPNTVVLDYMWYGSSPQRVEEVRRAMWMSFKAHVLPDFKGDFEIKKPLKITPRNPKARDQQNSWFRVEVPVA